MVALVREFNLLAGTVAHLDVGGAQRTFGAQECFVQGAASGMWHDVLEAHDFDVRLVAAFTWKWALQLARRGAVGNKDDSRELATRLFAKRDKQVAAALQRVKDHGRAEALLNAAHGHWAEGGRDVLTLVQSSIVRAQLRSEEIRTIRTKTRRRPDGNIYLRLKRLPMPNLRRE